MYKFLTIKQGENLYRLLKIEEAGDKSIYIHRIHSLKAKSSYHHNHGEAVGPFRYHQYGPSGSIIPDSIDERRTFITEYKVPFQRHGFVDGWPATSRIEAPKKKDVVLDLSDRKLKNHRIELFSEKRKDLLDCDFDNAVIAEVPLKTCSIIAGCFDLQKI